MPRLLVVHHTPSPALQAMFEAAVSGARTDEIEGVEVVVRPALTAAAVDVLEADGYLLGTPVQLAFATLQRSSAYHARYGHPNRPPRLGRVRRSLGISASLIRSVDERGPELHTSPAGPMCVVDPASVVDRGNQGCHNTP
jgi:hypothetical protein